jgi:glucose/arabinose dehydrogenase
MLVAVCLVCGLPVIGQDAALPPCAERAGYRFEPRVDHRYYCFERVIEDHTAGEFAFTALEFAPDGRLFATRPQQGQLLALSDTDNDGLVDSPQIIAEDLTLPNALKYAEGALYIAGGSHIYRLDAGDTLTTLVDDLPSGTGFWTGGIAVGDGRIFVGIGAPCEACIWDDPARGSVLSFALDGSDQRIEARGLRYPIGLLYAGGSLYVTDSVPFEVGQIPLLDEINRVQSGAHFGYPYCIGADNTPFVVGDFDCATATAPLITVASGSVPLELTLYQGAAFPHLQGQLLVTLGGAFGNRMPNGYGIAALDFAALDNLEGTLIQTLVPQDTNLLTASDAPIYLRQLGIWDVYSKTVNERGAGIYPHQLYNLAVSPEGWVYFSVGGGYIGVLRPQ